MKIFIKAIATAMIVLMLGMLVSGCAEKTSTDTDVQVENIEEGKLIVKTIDKATKKPVSDAKVTIIGMENSFKTDENGMSPEITLKVNKDVYKKYGEELLKKVPSGSAAVLISKEGYKDFLLFNKAIYPGNAANTLSVQLTKLSKNDKENYVVDFQYPHDMWLQELIQYSSNIKEENDGDGENKITFNIKDQNSKAIQDAAVIIPELGIKAVTDKNGKAVLNPPTSLDTLNLYPVIRQNSDYTVVVAKEGYAPSVVFNITAGDTDSKPVNITIKTTKNKEAGEYNKSFYPYEKDWVEKIINNYKK